jgi:hypothetical protein
LLTSQPATNWQSWFRVSESNTRAERVPMPITPIRTLLFAPCHANIGLVAATVKAATELFRNLRLLAIEPLSFVSITLENAGTEP